MKKEHQCIPHLMTTCHRKQQHKNVLKLSAYEAVLNMYKRTQTMDTASSNTKGNQQVTQYIQMITEIRAGPHHVQSWTNFKSRLILRKRSIDTKITRQTTVQYQQNLLGLRMEPRAEGSGEDALHTIFHNGIFNRAEHNRIHRST